MDQDRWRTVNRIFHNALEIPPGDRERFIASATCGDRDLESEVESLLEADQEAGKYLEDPLISTQSLSPRDTTIQAGETLCNRFKVIREVAEGGMGRVFEAFDSELGVSVALKIIRPEIASNPAVISRFRQEVRLARLITHPNICRTFDLERDVVPTALGSDQEVVFLTMEFLQGETLASRIQREGALSVSLALSIAEQIASGIDCAHEQGIIHRDLKPGNIMLVPGGSQDEIRAVITDFGLARSAAVKTDNGFLAESHCEGLPIGTLSYMAPEQLEGKPITPATDIYSFGLILIEMICGKRAFPSENFLEGISQRITGIAPLIAPEPKLPDRWNAGIDWCLRRTPSDRPNGASEALAILKGKCELTKSDNGSQARQAIPILEAVSSEEQAQGTAFKARAQANSLHRWRWALTAGISVVVLSSAALWYASHLKTALHIGDVVQITNDPRSIAKGIAGTDGSRIYLNLYESPARFGEVPVIGGDITVIPMEHSGSVGPLSPDGRSFIVHGDRFPKDQQSDISIVSTAGIPVRLLARGQAASWSADGKLVIYSNSKGEIYTIPSSGGKPRLIRALGGSDLPFDFAYSPDGSKVRFVWGPHRLMEMSPDGSDLHEIVADWHSKNPKCCGFWAPDGSFFFFFSAASSEVAGFPAYQMWALDERRGWMHKAAKEPVQLTLGPMTWLDWAFTSRDGRKIFASGENWRGELVRYNQQTKQLEPFLNGISADMLDFSRDGRNVLYASFPGTTLLRADRNGTNVQQIVSLSDHPVNPRWSPDGSQIVFTYSDQAGRNLAYVVAAKGGAPTLLLPDDKSLNQVDPTWSADGKKIALWVESPEGKTESELRIVDIATHKVSFLPRPPKRTWSPRWSPDGRYIVCLTNPFPYTDGLEIYDFNTNQWKIILSEAGSGSWPSWSHDSRWIYYSAKPVQQNHFMISRISVEGKVRERVMDLPGFRGTGYDWSWMGLDPNDNPLLLRDAGTSEVYALTLER